MTQASQKITQQYKDGGVIPAQLVGQDATSKTYVDGQLSLRDANINAAMGAAGAAQSDVNQHKISTSAHPAQNVTYTGKVTGVKDVKQAIDAVKTTIDQAIVSGDSGPEARTARYSTPQNKTYDTLKDRLDTSDVQLADKASSSDLSAAIAPKADKTYVDGKLNDKLDVGGEISVTQINKNNGLIDETYLTDTLKQQIAGTANIYATVSDRSITQRKMVEPYVEGEPGKNLFDKGNVTAGYYVAYWDGTLAASAGYNASDFIPVTPGTSYTVSGTPEQYALYDANKNYTTGGASSILLGVIPSGSVYIRLTVKDAELNSTQLEKGSVATGYEPFKITIKKSAFSEDVLTYIRDGENYEIVTVSPDGTKDYLSIKAANDTIYDSSKARQYLVVIYPGTYTDINIDLKDYVHLIGVSKDQCILQGEQPDSSGDSLITNNSTLNLKHNNTIKNLTITARNMRYAVHDETNNAVKEWDRVVEDCIIIHHGNNGARTWRDNNPGSGMSSSTVWESECAYGSGASSGSKSIFKNVLFESAFSPYSVHNETNFEKASSAEFDNCRFILSPNPLSSYAIRIAQLISGKKDQFVFRGCYANAPLSIQNDTPANTAVRLDIGGYASEFMYDCYFDGVSWYAPVMSDEVQELVASESILKGQVVAFSGSSGIRKMTNSDSVHLFAGIAMENINAGALGKVKHRGYINVGDLPGVSLTQGNTYAVNASSALEAATNNIIGFAVTADHFKITAG